MAEPFRVSDSTIETSAAQQAGISRWLDESSFYTSLDADPEMAVRYAKLMMSGQHADDEDEHFPWHYTEFGVECVCGLPMDRDETCAAMRAKP